MKTRNAFCSFCRQSYRDVGPLVEGPGDVLICGECIELCQEILKQEKCRRSPPAGRPELMVCRAKLAELVSGQEEAVAALARSAQSRQEGRGPVSVLLLGPSRSSRLLLARALAHVLGVPFAAGDGQALGSGAPATGGLNPLLYQLLDAADFDIEAAQGGVVYVEGVDHREAQESMLHLWEWDGPVAPGTLHVEVSGILFVCGGAFVGLHEVVTRRGRHPEQPVEADILVAYGMLPDFVGRLKGIARAAPLDEETLVRLLPLVDFGRLMVRGEMGSRRIPSP
jgi:ATP-dependent Clp protease ATP-binding subunit ClpX